MTANEFAPWVVAFLTGRETIDAADLQLIRDAALVTVGEIANSGLPDAPPPTDGV